MIVLATILIILGVILVAAVLILLVGNAKIRIVSQDQLRAFITICGIRYSVYPDKEDVPKKPRNLARCHNPEAVLRRELKRRQRIAAKAARKKIRAAKRSAKRTEKKVGVPPKYCPVPNLKENLEMILELAKKLVKTTRGKVKIKLKKLHIRVATDDAAQTALLYGVVIQLISYLFGFVEENYASIQRHDGDLVVEPDYNNSECSADIDLVFQAKLWRAILIVVEMENARDLEKKRAYRKAALREREQADQPRFDLKNILTRIRKDHSLWKTNLLSRK